MKFDVRIRKVAGSIVAAVLLWTAAAPAIAHAGVPADDLKQIEYKYYFRGKYDQAILALETFLARVDLTPADVTRAREFLAASHVLQGSPTVGKEVFTRMIVANPAYAGPDPAIFKPEVMDAYASARADYKPLTSQVPAPVIAETKQEDDAPTTAVLEPASKPIYKKWWFYAGAAAVIGTVAAVAGGGGGEEDAPARGSVVVGVTVK